MSENENKVPEESDSVEESVEKAQSVPAPEESAGDSSPTSDESAEHSAHFEHTVLVTDDVPEILTEVKK